ncbi:MAG: YnbE family lipoprotein [Verrucomicrobiota bacterium]
MKLMRSVPVTSIVLLAGCGPLRTEHRVQTDPIRVEPIEINVNVRVQVERELDDFFDDLDSKDQTIKENEKETNQ